MGTPPGKSHEAGFSCPSRNSLKAPAQPRHRRTGPSRGGGGGAGGTGDRGRLTPSCLSSRQTGLSLMCHAAGSGLRFWIRMHLVAFCPRRSRPNSRAGTLMRRAGPWWGRGGSRGHLGVGSGPSPATCPAPAAAQPPGGTLKAASMCNTTGQGESLMSHSRSWLARPGAPPVNFNSKASTSLGSGGGRDSERWGKEAGVGSFCGGAWGLVCVCQAAGGADHRAPWTPAQAPFTLRSPSPDNPGRVRAPPAVPPVPMVPMQGSTSMM